MDFTYISLKYQAVTIQRSFFNLQDLTAYNSKCFYSSTLGLSASNLIAGTCSSYSYLRFGKAS